jgi:hypothetical protein
MARRFAAIAITFNAGISIKGFSGKMGLSLKGVVIEWERHCPD